MRAASLLILGLLILPCAAQDGIPDHPDKLTYEPLHFEIPNPEELRMELSTGTPAYIIEDNALPIVELKVYFRAGSTMDPEGKEGLADLLGTMMRIGGTSNRTPEQLDNDLDFIAADLSISLSSINGSAHLSVLRKNIDKGLELLFDVLKNPAFNEDKFDITRAQVLQGLKSRNDSTQGIESRESDILFYGEDYPTNREATGASINTIQKSDFEAFHRKYFHPKNFIIAVAGSITRKELAGKLESYLADWPEGGEIPSKLPPVKHAPEPGVYTFDKPDVNQGRVTFGHMGIDIRHPDASAIRIMSYIYGAGGFASRLVDKVRTEEALAYSVYSDFRPGNTITRPFKVSFQSKSESCAYATQLCLDVLDSLQKEGPTAQEVKAAVQFYVDGFPGFFFSTPLDTATTYAAAELLDYPKGYYQSWRENLLKVTVKDVQRVAAEHLIPEKFIYIYVGNVEAMSKGDGEHDVTLESFGKVTAVPLPDPVTLERPKD
jgi:zinc protease